MCKSGTDDMRRAPPGRMRVILYKNAAAPQVKDFDRHEHAAFEAAGHVEANLATGAEVLDDQGVQIDAYGSACELQ